MKENIYSLIELIKKNEDALPDYEKIKELTPKILLDWRDINHFLYRLPECDCDIPALEAVLLAVDGDVRRRIEGNGLAKAVLFHLYHDGKYEILIHDRVVKINAPELKSRERYDAFIASDCPEHFIHVGDKDIIPNVYTPSAHDYMMFYLFGTNFGCDIDKYPVPELEDPSAKNFERAIRYLPTFVDYLATKKLPERGIERTLDRMEKAGYSFEEIAHFCREWFETIEKKNLVCKPLMDIYLFGEYEIESRGGGRTFDFSDKKSFSVAKSFVPSYVTWLCDVYSSNCVYIKDYYDPDLVLRNYARKMGVMWWGYSDADISDFATLWMQETMKQNKVFYSLMYMRLFGEHFGGTRVNIGGIIDFDVALALIPKYLEYLFDYRGDGDEYCYVFDSDEQLYELILAMRKHSYSEDDVSTFVMSWINAAIASGRPCNSPMYAYLFGKFIFKHENMEFELPEDVKSFERAIEFIPTWLAFLTNESIQYCKDYNPSNIIELLIRMYEAGYSETEIELLLSKYLDALCDLAPGCIVEDVKDNLLTEAKKNPWLNKYLPVLNQYIKVAEEKQNNRFNSRLSF